MSSHSQKINQLRKSGVKVFIRHIRPTVEVFVSQGFSSAFAQEVFTKEKVWAQFGGKTTVELTEEKTGIVVIAESLCGKKERFIRSRGVQIALGRAGSQLADSKVKLAELERFSYPVAKKPIKKGAAKKTTVKKSVAKKSK